MKIKLNFDSFIYLLSILFIGLKLTGHIAWSWIWVLSPIWISFVIAVVFLAIYVVWLYKNEK
jgi:hypothetical protein